MKKIFILGVPAAGKTYFGKKLAEKNGYIFYDLNQEIAQKLALPEDKALVLSGEEKYRQVEAQLCAQIFSESAGESLGEDEGSAGVVYALSGGCLDQENMRIRVKEYFAAGNKPEEKLVILQASLETIAPRIGLNQPRPVALGTPRFWLRQLLSQREKNWESLPATWINTDGKTESEIMAQLSELV